MGLDDERSKNECFCSKSCKNCKVFQRVIDVTNAGLVIKRHMSRKEDNKNNTGVVETANNSAKDVFILQNTKDFDFASDEIISEFEQNTVSCPRCSQLLQHAQRLLHKVSTCDEKVTIGLCDHCKTEEQIAKSCYECEEVVRKFVISKDDLNKESKQRVKVWLSKVKHLLKDILTEVNQSRKNNSRSYSDPYINRLGTFPDPEVNKMFYPKAQRSHHARLFSQENMSTLRFKELSDISDICLNRHRKDSSIFDHTTSLPKNEQVKTSGEEKHILGIRKYHSEEALQATISSDRILRNDFSYSFPKSDDERRISDHYISSADLIGYTRDILRNKARMDKIKHEEDEKKVLEINKQTKRLAGDKNKETEKSQIKSTNDDLQKKTIAVGEKKEFKKRENQMLVVENNTKDNKDEENLHDGKTLTGDKQKNIAEGKKHDFVDADVNYANKEEKNKIVGLGKRKTDRTEKRSFGAEKKKFPGGEIMSTDEDETHKTLSGKKATIPPQYEMKKLAKGETTKLAKDKETHKTLSGQETTSTAKYEIKKRAKGETMKLAKDETKNVAESKTKKIITVVSTKETTNVTEKSVQNILHEKPRIKSNISAKITNDPTTKVINKNKPEEKTVDEQYPNVGKTQKEPKNKNEGKNSRAVEKIQQERQHEKKSKKNDTTASKDEEPISVKHNKGEEQTNNENKKIKDQELAGIKTTSTTDKIANESAEMKLKKTKEKLIENQEQELFNMIKKHAKPPRNDLLVKSTQDNKNQTKLKNLSRISLPSLQMKTHKIHSDSDLDMMSKVYKKDKPFELGNIIIGQKLFKYKPSMKYNKFEIEGNPALLKTEFKEDLGLVGKKDILGTIPEEVERKPLPLLQRKEIKSIDQELPKGIVRYALSDRTFIDKGWTMLPTEKVVRKMNVYRMRPVHPEFDWFEHNKNKRLMQYETGEKLAEFDDNGRGRWYYKNGQLALDYYDAEEVNAQQRFVVYSSGEPDKRGRSHARTILATFDYLGNGIVFDHSGKLRLKYNQTEGVVLDREIGPVSHWKWHTLNDPPVLQQVMIDTQIAHKVPEILKLGGPSDRKARVDNEEMLAIEFDNFINEKSKKITQVFKPFQIKMKALKINDYFSLKVLDQATIYLIFRDGSTNLKLNIGMLLDHKEIVDTDTAEVGEVSNNLERFPARTGSIAEMQRSVAYAQHFERSRMEREHRLRPPAICRSVDRLTAATSRPMRPPLRTVPSDFTIAAGERYCRLNRKPSLNLYYDTRLV